MTRPTRPLRILCVDDNRLLLDALSTRLSSEPDFTVLSPLTAADELPRVASQLRPDIVLLDIDMPGRDPFDALAELMRLVPDARVLVLSGHVAGDLVDLACAHGAWGYISKMAGTDAILMAIDNVLRAEFVVSFDIPSAKKF